MALGRRFRGTWSGCVTLSVLVLLPLHLSSQETPSSTIRGRVLDLEAGTPLDGATVRLPGLGLGRLTNVQGWFQFDEVPLGTHELKVEALGYSTRTDTLTLSRGQLLDLTVTLSVDPIPMEGITVTARPRWLASTGYFRRQESANAYSGRQWSREEIEARHAVFVQDILTTVPGIQMKADRAGKVRLFGRRNCPLAFYVDDAYIPDFKMETLDPEWIEALEVYHGRSSFMPIEYGIKHCGVVLIWLRRSGGGSAP